MDKISDALQSVRDLADSNKELTYAFAAIGAGVVGLKLAKCLRSVYRYTIRPSHNLAKRYGDNWAVVTGASDGIGKALAFELASKGFKVGLVGRNQDKLEAVAKDIAEQHKVETKVVVFDFNVHYTAEKIAELSELLGVFEKVSILVNNVGMASYNPLEKMTDENVLKQINVNVVGTTVVSKIMIPKLRANENRAAMLIIASIAAESPCPNLAVYSATKSYDYQLGLSLAQELKDKIDVTVVNTASVKSNMNSGRFLFTITPEQHAKHVLSKLGFETLTAGHTIHAFGRVVSRMPISRSIVDYIHYKRRQQFIAERDAKLKAETNNKKQEDENANKDPENKN
eukprot:CAMPEP_0168328960 /NCGR_PEP_ID=MMETSP0213-20121227/6823_1 /TAXON_ID=151035 /ORGANISM="Euplotes harpa, Strain FSP1.4" /LENGTH=341 /DNA_ID=CAMNT_0008332193 /DNA_START=99 /DNA_END=1124 /DNA_ORIENTATION=+